MTHKISTDRAYEIDLDFCNNSRHGGDMLRIASYRTAGNGTINVLCIPGSDNSPRYEYKRHNPETGAYAPAYYHVSGPTLDEWQLHEDARDQSEYGVNEWQYEAEAMQAEYRDEAETTATLRQF